MLFSGARVILPGKIGECSVQFVAEAAAPSIDDLVHEDAIVQRDRSPEMDIEVLERDRQQVTAVQITKAGLIDRNGTVESETPQAGIATPVVERPG